MPIKARSLALLLALLCLISACGQAAPTPDTTTGLPTAPAETTAAPATTAPITTDSPETARQHQLLADLTAALDAAPAQAAQEGDLRPFPYPYLAMLAITSDCDSTTVETFETIHRYLNTLEDTPYGPGLGLDIADSFFVYNGSNYEDAVGMMTWCQGTDPTAIQNAAILQKYYSCGWIDSIHTFGDFSRMGRSLFTRELAQAAWSLLEAANIRPTIWIDHGTATNIQNFGAYNPKNASSYQAGDDPDSPYYHTDLTLASGIRYVWYSRHSSRFGQDFPLTPHTLRDGSQVWSFTRYTNEMDGNTILWNWRPNQLDEQITSARLDALEEKGQYCIIGQHMAMFQDKYQPEDDDLAALRLLAQRHHNGRILVARTSRLLDYSVSSSYITWQTARIDDITAIRLLDIDDPVTGPRQPTLDEVRGLTFYCDTPEKVLIFIGDTLLDADFLQVNPADDTGRASIGIAWHPADTTDYTQS